MSTTVTATVQEPVTASNVLRLFPDVQSSYPPTHNAHTTSTSQSATDNDLAGYDEEQIKLMDEVCIVLDNDDKPIGSASKKTCHLMKNIDAGLLHRAFSLFLFSPSKGNKLLLQQRASEKITFPDMWTNTCCSHPLGIPGETGADLEAAVMGVKRAAQRKVEQELGIKKEQVPIENMRFLTRIHYKAESSGTWGEHESESANSPLCLRVSTSSLKCWVVLTRFLSLVDYILFIQADVDYEPNPNEVRDAKYVSPEDLKAMFRDSTLKYTPWFKLICETMLFDWWDNLERGSLGKFENEKEIRRM